MRNKLILMSDSHLATKYPLSVDPFPFKDPFYLSAVKGINQAVTYSFDNGCDILHSGDLFHNDEIGAPDLFAASQFFYRVTHNGGTVLFNPGNHEISFQNPIPSVAQSLSYAFPGVWTVGPKQEYVVKKWNGLNVYMIPYYKESVFNDVLKKVVSQPIQQPAALCIHQNIKGIQVGNAVLQDGMGQEEICNLVKDKFKFIVCGHIHHRRIDERYGIPLLIPGSTMAMDFRDEGSTKSFYVLEFDKSYNIKDVKTIDIKDQIKFVSMDIHSSTRGCKNTYFKVSATPDEHDAVRDFEKKVREVGAIGVQPKWVRNKVERQPQGFERPVSMGVDQWLVQYMKKKGYDDSEISRAIDTNQKIFKA